MTKTVNICGIYSSLEEVFEICWTQQFSKINQGKCKIEQGLNQIFNL